MAKAPLDIVISARDQATTVMDKVNDRFISKAQNLVLGLASISTGFRLASKGADVWGASTELASARASGSLDKMLEGQAKLNDAWVGLAGSVPVIGKDIANVLNLLSGSDEMRQSVANIRAIESSVRSTSKVIQGLADARKLSEAAGRGPADVEIVKDVIAERKEVELLTKARQAEAHSFGEMEAQLLRIERVVRGDPLEVLRRTAFFGQSGERLIAGLLDAQQQWRKHQAERRKAEAELGKQGVVRVETIGEAQRKEFRKSIADATAAVAEAGRVAQQRREEHARGLQDAARQGLEGLFETAEEVFEAPPRNPKEARERRIRDRKAATARKRRGRAVQRGRGAADIDVFQSDFDIQGVPTAPEETLPALTVFDLAERARRQSSTPQRVTDPAATALLQRLDQKLAKLLVGIEPSDITGRP